MKFTTNNNKIIIEFEEDDTNEEISLAKTTVNKLLYLLQILKKEIPNINKLPFYIKELPKD